MFICWFSGENLTQKQIIHLQQSVCAGNSSDEKQKSYKLIRKRSRSLIHAKCSLGFSIFIVDTSLGGCAWVTFDKMRKNFVLCEFYAFLLVESKLTLVSNQLHPRMFSKLRKAFCMCQHCATHFVIVHPSLRRVLPCQQRLLCEHESSFLFRSGYTGIRNYNCK